LIRLALDDLHGQQVGEDRQGFAERAAFVMALNQADGFEHDDLLSGYADRIK
jgi:hypothetical protein